MRQKKNYFEEPLAKNVSTLQSASGRSWIIIANGTAIDFRRWKYLDRPAFNLSAEPDASALSAQRDDLVSLIKEAVWEIKDGGMTESTILNLCSSGLRYWFMFLDELHSQGLVVNSTTQITISHLNRYINWLNKRTSVKPGKKLSYTSGKAIFSATKSVLMQLCRMGSLNQSVFPLNPFPNVKRAYRGQEPLNKSEMERVLTALGQDLISIRNQTFTGSFADQITVYFLLISARSGCNLTPLLEMTLDCVQPHPLRDDMCVLQLYKRRGYKKSINAFETSKTNDSSSSVSSNVAQLVKEVILLTQDVRDKASEEYQDYLWLSPSKKLGEIGLFGEKILKHCISAFVERHAISADQHNWDGSVRPIVLNISRLRKTFGQRIWEISGGNLLRTAHLLGNLPQITDSHYLSVTPEMERNHKFVGTILHATIEGEVTSLDFKMKLSTQMNIPIEKVESILNGRSNTGVGRCTDYLYGRFSPRNGTDVCTRFLHCFRCPNQVVMESDLHRLFSFYWLLLKERSILGRSQWKKVYSWVIREIDSSIASNFDSKIVEREKARARIEPHPMWRDRGMLGVKTQ